MRKLSQVAAWLVCALGLLHLAVGYAAFTDPTERRSWFASAGFLLIVTGLANLAAVHDDNTLLLITALAGSLSILVIGALLIAANPGLGLQPQTLVLLALGLLLTIERLRGIGARRA